MNYYIFACGVGRGKDGDFHFIFISFKEGGSPVNASLPGTSHLLCNTIIELLRTKLIYTIIKNVQMIFGHVCLRVSCGSLQQLMENCGSWSQTGWPPLF